MQLHLIRHPRPAIEPGICYGQSDIGLAESAVEVATRLKPLLPDAYTVHASPLLRARLLAVEGVWQTTGAPGTPTAVRHLVLQRCKDVTPLLGRLAQALDGSRDFH